MKSISATTKRALAFAIANVLAMAAAPLIQAQTFSVVHDFASGSDGSAPKAGLVMDRLGNLYGTTTAGGTSGAGTVFKMTRKGKETVMYSFAGGMDGGRREQVWSWIK
jgi:uncharacterized repeat protein (TIGR03803 family)